MLEIRPNCELCDKDLPADSVEAMICSYECTFCQSCVESVLDNVCPNCGGGFVFRPIRPKTAWRKGVSTQYHPVSQKRILTQYTKEELRDFAATITHIPPENR
ncbi:DUF1272 domain-containing protein [Pleionea sediminis]|uniref:DUF1272 domain-containing protein n=1 Tax=Pleionea sediminis TaxID=2569479 RepID=UPI00118671C3|nr:DUF1272 domain-containing protein [Pleionea sediminis]